MVLTDFKDYSPRETAALGDVDATWVEGVWEDCKELGANVYGVAIFVIAFGSAAGGFGCAGTGGGLATELGEELGGWITLFERSGRGHWRRTFLELDNGGVRYAG